MRTIRTLALVVTTSIVATSGVNAWGPAGHQSVGAIADTLLKGSHAATQVHALLGPLTLEDASVWADCAKGVDPATFTYQGAGKYPECGKFETPDGEAAMVDFVRRNATSCTIKAGEEICHKQYHYSDISIGHDHYATTFVGARNDDVVHAVTAAVDVLKGKPAPAPFDFKDKKEALLVLAHYLGDLHQPLHVGAVYLDASGQRVNPDKGTFDPATATRGGNEILVKDKVFHAMWDDIPSTLGASHAKSLKAAAAAVPPTTGPVGGWSKKWGSETVAQAQAAFAGVTFGPVHEGKWTAKLPTSYTTHADAIKKQQIVRAGARLAQLLNAIWP
jgi:hypothetical protein